MLHARPFCPLAASALDSGRRPSAERGQKANVPISYRYDPTVARSRMLALPKLSWWRSTRRVAELIGLSADNMADFARRVYREQIDMPLGVCKRSIRPSRSRSQSPAASPAPSRSPSPSFSDSDASDAESLMGPPAARQTRSFFWFFVQTDPLTTVEASIADVHSTEKQQALEKVLIGDVVALSDFMAGATIPESFAETILPAISAEYLGVLPLPAGESRASERAAHTAGARTRATFVRAQLMLLVDSGDLCELCYSEADLSGLYAPPNQGEKGREGGEGGGLWGQSATGAYGLSYSTLLGLLFLALLQSRTFFAV